MVLGLRPAIVVLLRRILQLRSIRAMPSILLLRRVRLLRFLACVSLRTSMRVDLVLTVVRVLRLRSAFAFAIKWFESHLISPRRSAAVAPVRSAAVIFNIVVSIY